MPQLENSVSTFQDDYLVTLLLEGHNSGYEILYDKYSAMLYNILKRIVQLDEDAENLLQDCFVKIWRNIGQFDASKGRFSTWLINIARNTAIDFTRSKVYSQRQKNQTIDNLVSVPADSSSTISIDTIGLQRLVQGLTPQCRQIIEWMYFEGYTQQEISDNFNLPLGTVKSRTRTAMIELRKYYEL